MLEFRGHCFTLVFKSPNTQKMSSKVYLKSSPKEDCQSCSVQHCFFCNPDIAKTEVPTEAFSPAQALPPQYQSNALWHGMHGLVSPGEAFCNSGQDHVGSYKVTGAEPQREECLQLHSLRPPTTPPLEEAHRPMKAS